MTGENFGFTQAALVTGTIYSTATGSGLAGWRVYIDSNNNGKWESSEASVLTDSSGNWSFGDLAPGVYDIRVVPQKGYTLSARPAVNLSWPSATAASAVAIALVNERWGERRR